MLAGRVASSEWGACTFICLPERGRGIAPIAPIAPSSASTLGFAGRNGACCHTRQARVFVAFDDLAMVGQAVEQRANSILARLLAEPGLSRGHIVFVAHSLGGLIVEQILRSAQRDAGSDQRAEQFLVRARRVAFLGTPHRGSFLATLAMQCRLLVRPSDATRDLLPGSPHLKDLNNWYRQYSRDNGIQNLLLVEGKSASVCGISLPKFVGVTVSEESADGGLQETPIPIDESHSGICKPASKEAEVYVHVQDFISRPHDGGVEVTHTKEVLEKNTRELQRLRRPRGTADCCNCGFEERDRQRRRGPRCAPEIH